MRPKPQKLKSKTAPQIIRAVAPNKRGSGRGQDKAPYLPPIPNSLPLRKYRQWVQRSTKEEEISDHILVDDVSKGKQHPAVNPYWGNIDDQKETYLFTEPSMNYSPLSCSIWKLCIGIT